MSKIILILTVIIILYLNRTYAYFYDYQKNYTVPVTNTQTLPMNPNLRPFKLVTLGDSLMDGDLSNFIGQAFSQQYNVTLINLATPGAKADDVLKSQIPQITSQNPDEIIVMVGINDVQSTESMDNFQSLYKNLLQELGNTSKITLVNIPYLGSDKILFFPWNFLVNFRTNQFNFALKQIAVGKNVNLVDLNGEFKLKFRKSSDLYSADQFHPSSLGYSLWAKYIYANSSK